MSNDVSTRILDIECLGRIINDRQIVGVGDALNTKDFATVPVTVHGQYRFGLGGNRCFDMIGIKVSCHGVNIHKNWIQPQDLHCMLRRDEGERCCDDLALATCNSQSSDECHRPAGHQNNMIDPKPFRENLFKAIMKLTSIGQKPASPYFFKPV